MPLGLANRRCSSASELAAVQGITPKRANSTSTFESSARAVAISAFSVYRAALAQFGDAAFKKRVGVFRIAPQRAIAIGNGGIQLSETEVTEAPGIQYVGFAGFKAY
jgi:hypothetical protein